MAVVGTRSFGDVLALAGQLACQCGTQIRVGRDALDECTAERREALCRRRPGAEGRRTGRALPESLPRPQRRE
jgi:hypothetical protein